MNKIKQSFLAITIALSISACANIQIVEQDQKSVTLCGPVLANKRHFLEKAQDACDSEKVTMVKFFRTSQMSSLSGQGNGNIGINYQQQNCMIFSCN